jgi:hypothetical protein
MDRVRFCFSEQDETTLLLFAERPASPGDKLVRELANIRLLLGMFDRHADHAPLLIEFNKNVLIEVTSLDYLLLAESHKQGIGIRKVLNFHGLPPENGGRKMRCAQFHGLPARPREGTFLPPLEFCPNAECGRLTV